MNNILIIILWFSEPFLCGNLCNKFENKDCEGCLVAKMWGKVEGYTG